MLLRSTPDLLDIERFGDAEASPDLVIEVPHGATETADFTRLAAELEGPHPEALIEFFHVNTDAGAPELARRVAEALVRDGRARAVTVLRCRIPRTFIDTNRRLDPRPAAEPGALPALAGRVTPGLMPWVTTLRDEALLVGRHAAYTRAVADLLQSALPRAGLLLLHSYAPRSIDVDVTPGIVRDLRAAYAPERIETWPLRPPLDVIHRAPDGGSRAPEGFVARLLEAFDGIEPVGDDLTYPLHPATMAYAHVERWPGRVACLEVRRDLLASDFVPLRPVLIAEEKVRRLAEPLARALEVVLPKTDARSARAGLPTAGFRRRDGSTPRGTGEPSRAR